MRLTQRTQEADAAQSALVQAKAQGQQQQVALAQTQQQGDQQQAALALSDAKLRSVQEEIKALNAKPTERGRVVTLGDVLFATGASSLQEQGMRHLMGLADFLKRHPGQQAAIDDYTDNVGSAASNQLLSERRASSVREGLSRRGVNAPPTQQPRAWRDGAPGLERKRRGPPYQPPGGGSGHRAGASPSLKGAACRHQQHEQLTKQGVHEKVQPTGPRTEPRSGS